MSSNAITVSDFRTQIPGEFSENRLSWKFPLIVAKKRGSDKNIHWNICVRVVKAPAVAPCTFLNIKDEFYDTLPPDTYAWIKVFKKHDGADKWDATKPTIVKKGKNIGKKNATNAFTQALRDAYGYYNKQLDRATPARIGAEHEAVRYPPMLVQKLGTQDLNYGDLYVQRKLDGIRTVAVLEKKAVGADAPANANDVDTPTDTSTDTVLLYSRTKKAYEGKQYIKDAVAPMLRHARDVMGINVYLDGEVYQHGISLQTLSGEMRQSSGKEDPNIRMTFHIFDLFVPDQPQLTYVERKRILDDLFVNTGATTGTITSASTTTYLKNVETFHTTSRAEIDALYASFLEAGFEGAIVRIPDRAYEYSHKGYHSSALLKMKPCFDSEYEIIGYKGEEGKGKAEGSVMWIVKTEDGIPFDVTPMGTIESRVQLFGEMREVVDGKTKFEREYLGRMLTVRYDDLSDDGVPLRARGVALRDYE